MDYRALSGAAARARRARAAGSLAGGLFQFVFFESHRDQLRHALLWHRDAVEGVGGGHGNFVVRDHDELRGPGELF